MDTCKDQHCFRSKCGREKKGENVMIEPMSWAISKTEFIILP